MKINRETDMLLIVDPQNDFFTGSLAVSNSEEIVPVINNYIDHFEIITISRDKHVAQHPSFAAQGGPWPDHCVDGTWGYEFHEGLRIPLLFDKTAFIVNKGLYAEAYSAFEGVVSASTIGKELTSISLGKLLKELSIRRLFICGLATDYCVKASTLDALKTFRFLSESNQFDGEVFLLIDAIRSVDVNPGDGDKALNEMLDAGAKMLVLEGLEDDGEA